MTPTTFEQANCKFGTPEGLDESQVMTIHAYRGPVVGGSVDGAQLVVTAWKPTEAEIEVMKAGAPVFLSVLGGLPPHFLTTDFEQAVKPM